MVEFSGFVDPSCFVLGDAYISFTFAEMNEDEMERFLIN